MNVLIAEDDALTRFMLQRAVERHGHVCLASDGLQAWQLGQAHTVDAERGVHLRCMAEGD